MVFHVISGPNDDVHVPAVRKITVGDLWQALARGLEDFREMPSHLPFLIIIYPVMGLLLGRATYDNNLMPLVYPLITGFALIGPFAAIGLYEMSKRREQGLDTSWKHAFDVLRSPSIWAIGALAVALMAIFFAWVTTAHAIYQSIFGIDAPKPMGEFFATILGTPEGLRLIVIGNIVGLCFALVVLLLSAVSFPMLVDRDVGAAVAVATSIKAALVNPIPILVWGLVVAISLLAGALPLFVGLAVVLPVLGHATWHLYRKLVV